MEQHDKVEGAYSTEIPSGRMYGVEEDLNLGNRDLFQQNLFRTFIPAAEIGTSSSGVTFDSGNSKGAIPFGTQFQEFLIRALMQSTTSFTGPPSGVMGAPQDRSTGTPMQSIEGAEASQTWSEATYNMVEATRKQKTTMTRTSAGEGSDSQEEFPVPQNESPQQRSLRTRRLNRSRARRAKDLTSNRKALKKLPHVIFVDGTAKAKGIHRHLWRAAVRGQCGRLDPTMDNINHHPKHVVDSIWHALEKEWEFEGFVHRAREMFERSATKFMRNRKMQLKYKCQKNVDGPKPGDVSAAHWSKIVDLTMKSGKQTISGSCSQSSRKGKGQESAEEKENWDSLFSPVVVQEDMESRILDSHFVKSDFSIVENEDVDARIYRLQTELLRLQNSRKFGLRMEGGSTSAIAESSEVRIVSAEDSVLKEMKENIMPRYGKEQHQLQLTMGTIEDRRRKELQRKLLCASQEKKSSSSEATVREVQVQESGDDINETEMDCGDVV